MVKTTGVRICGIGRAVPELVASNDDYAKIVETNDEWITQRTGIKTRRISNGEPNYFFGAKAAAEAIADAGITAADIGLIICATCTPDYYTPSEACLILLTVKCIITIPLNQPDCQCSNYCLRGALFNFCGTTTVQLRQPKCSVGNEQGVQTPAKYLEVVVLSLLETSAVQERISNTGWIIDHAFEINYMVILYVILFKSNLDVSKACF